MTVRLYVEKEEQKVEIERLNGIIEEQKQTISKWIAASKQNYTDVETQTENLSVSTECQTEVNDVCDAGCQTETGVLCGYCLFFFIRVKFDFMVYFSYF